MTLEACIRCCRRLTPAGDLDDRAAARNRSFIETAWNGGRPLASPVKLRGSRLRRVLEVVTSHVNGRIGARRRNDRGGHAQLHATAATPGRGPRRSWSARRGCRSSPDAVPGISRSRRCRRHEIVVRTTRRSPATPWSRGCWRASPKRSRARAPSLRGSADAVRRRASWRRRRIGRRRAQSERRPHFGGLGGVSARGAAGRLGDDRLRLPRSWFRLSACFAGQTTPRPTCLQRGAAHAVRVPGRNRHGYSRNPSPPGRLASPATRAPGATSTKPPRRRWIVMAWVEARGASRMPGSEYGVARAPHIINCSPRHGSRPRAKWRWLRAPAAGFGFAVAQALAREGAFVPMAPRTNRRFAPPPSASAVKTCWPPRRRQAGRGHPADPRDRRAVGGVDLLFANAGGRWPARARSTMPRSSRRSTCSS